MRNRRSAASVSRLLIEEATGKPVARDIVEEAGVEHGEEDDDAFEPEPEETDEVTDDDGGQGGGGTPG